MKYFYDAFKVLCYLQSEEIWIAVLRNWYIFGKSFHLHLIVGKAYIICKYISYRYFQKLQLLEITKFWNNFYCIVLLFVWAQKACLRIFEILFQSANINIFVLLGVFFGGYNQLKSFAHEKKQCWNLKYTLIEKLSKINIAKY